MTDRSITECYFHNTIGMTCSSVNDERNEYKLDYIDLSDISSLHENAESLEKNTNEFNKQENDCTRKALVNNKLNIQNEVISDSSLKYSYESNKESFHKFFTNDTNGPDSFTYIENIFDEPHPFSEISSFSDYSNILEHSGEIKINDLQEGNYEHDKLLDNNDRAYFLFNDDNKKISTDNLIINNSSQINSNTSQIYFQELADQSQNQIKPFLYDSYKIDYPGKSTLSPDTTEHHKANFNSKSLSNLNLYTENVSKECIDSKKVNKTKDKRLKGSVTNLDDRVITKQPFISKKPRLQKAKSISLNNLHTYKKCDYSHVQSKVKSYIKNIKQKNPKTKISDDIKSLPSTPLKDDNNATVLELDAKTFQLNDELEEYFQNSNLEINEADFNKNLLEKLFQQLKEERKSRVEQDILLNTLQLKYDNLLAKYAQAENIIDKLRIYRGAENIPNFNFSKNELDHRSYSQLKKAVSVSNLFPCYSQEQNNIEDIRIRENMVKYSSSPIVDPNISIIVQVKKDSDGSIINQSDISAISYTSDARDYNNTHSFLNQPEHNLTDDLIDPWIVKYETIRQKLKEFAMLEGNCAFQSNEEERYVIWNYLVELCAELAENSGEINLNKKQKLENLKEALHYLVDKYNLPVIYSLKNSIRSENLGKNVNDSYYSSSNKVTLDEDKICQVSTLPDIEINIPNSGEKMAACDRVRLDVREMKYFDDFLISKCSDTSGKKNSNIIVPKAKRNEIGMNEKDNFSLVNYSSSTPIRDIDSGCPQSDGSIRNSQCQTSMEQVLKKNSENQKSKSFTSLSTNETKTNVVKSKCEDSSYFSKLDLNPEAHSGYEADDDESKPSYGMNFKQLRKKNILKKPAHCEIDVKNSAKLINKYEDKYVIRYHSDQTDNSWQSQNSYSHKSCVPPISQFEKKTKHMKEQIASKYRNKVNVKRSKSPRFSLFKTPLKSLNYDSYPAQINVSPTSQESGEKSIEYNTKERNNVKNSDIPNKSYTMSFSLNKENKHFNQKSNSLPCLNYNDICSTSSEFKNLPECRRNSQIDYIQDVNIIDSLDEAISMVKKIKRHSKNVLYKTYERTQISKD